MMTPGGIMAMELFASEVYYAPMQPSSIHLQLDGELHTISLSSLHYPHGVVAVTTQNHALS